MKRDSDEQKALLSEMRRRIPQNPELVDTLISILDIGKESIYRRLRSEVAFSFQEIAIISKSLGISLDNLVGIETHSSKPFQLKFPDFIAPGKRDHYQFKDFLKFLERLANSEDTEIGMVTNTIPQDLFSGFENLIKFNIFRWQYYNNEQVMQYRNIVIPDIVKESLKKQSKEFRKIKNTYYIFGKHIYETIINDIKYFYNIRLIDTNDISGIKEDLLSLLDYIENFTVNGKFDETHNKVQFYITDLDIPTCYSYIRNKDVRYSLIKAFILTSATSLDIETYNKIYDWIQSYIKSATRLTDANEMQRIIYFREQREIISKL